MLLVSEAGALAGVWAQERRRELLPEWCPGCVDSGQVCCEASCFVSCRVPQCHSAAAALPCMPVLARRQLMSSSFLVHSQSQLLLRDHKYFL